MFTGKEYDAETGLYYFGARYLDPQLSRWMSVDPKGFELINPMDEEKGKTKRRYSVIESTNWYSYCNNNPVKFVDPNGKEVTSWIGIVNMDFGKDYSTQAAEQWSEGGYGWAAVSIVASASEFVYDELACLFGASLIAEAAGGTGVTLVSPNNNLGTLPLEINEDAQIFNEVSGEMHHIASDKSIKSGFTELYKRIFEKAEMSLSDPANKVFLEGHSGAHTNVYKQYVLDFLKSATEGLSGNNYKNALLNALNGLKQQLLDNPNMPYKGGME